MAYAIIETGGKQIWVEPGRFYDVERLPSAVDDDVSIDKVLFINSNGTVHIGQPYVQGATVEATVLRQLRGRKVLVYKMRPKKKTRKKQGHRQELTRLMINAISLNGETIAESNGSMSSQTTVTEVGTEIAAVEGVSEAVAEPMPAEPDVTPAEAPSEAGVEGDVVAEVVDTLAADASPAGTAEVSETSETTAD